MLLLKRPLCICSSVHCLIRWSVVGSPLLQAHVACSSVLNLWRQALVFPCPVTSAVKFGFKSIRNFSLSVTFGKNSFVIAAFVQSSHSFWHFTITSSSISLYSIIGGILLKAISVSLFRAAAFASRSASSFPYIPTWTLTQKILLSNLLFLKWISSSLILRRSSYDCLCSLMNLLIFGCRGK